MEMSLDRVSKWRTELMGIAAIWIGYGHMGVELFATRRPLFAAWGWALKNLGFFGVDIFFFLSGFGVYYALCKKQETAPQFWGRRFLRIYPAFFVLLLFSEMPAQGGFVQTIPYFTFWENFGVKMFHSWWYVPAACLFYLFSPLYCKLFMRAKRKGLFTGLCIALSVLGVPWYLAIERADFQSFIQRIPIYLLGIYCGWRRENPRPLRHPRLFAVGMVVLLLGGLVAGYYFNRIPLLLYFNCYPAFFVAFSLCMVASGLLEWYHTHLPRLNLYAPLSFIGACSLEFYLVQETVVHPAIETLAPFAYIQNIGLQNFWTFFLKVFLCAAIGYLLQRCLKCALQNPIHRLAARLHQGKAA